jgi:EAL domain-containing protein (putative c-di-GMP-specific phosphodiesterase class I)
VSPKKKEKILTAADADVVIVLDDNPIEREILAAMLRASGVRAVLDAGDGAAALALLRSHPAALVICDLSMPGMDGIEFIRAAAAQCPTVALFVISGVETKVLATARQLARKAGLNFVGAASKPVTMEQLRHAVAAARVATAPPAALALSFSTEELRGALEQGQIEVVYLPKVGVADGRLLGVEALARWRHPEHDVLGPEHFIALAERCGLIWELTLHVMRQAIGQAARWRAAGLPLPVAINIPAVGVGGLAFPDVLAGVVQQAGLDPSAVTLELTETQLADSTEIYDVVARLRLKGFALSIDDYGIGNSGLEQLRRLPFTELKIDRSLVHGAADDSELRAILESCIHLGRRLDMRVVAEGVERHEDWQLLAALDCESAQGFLISPPIPGGHIPAWAQQWQRSPLAGGGTRPDAQAAEKG